MRVFRSPTKQQHRSQKRCRESSTQLAAAECGCHHAKKRTMINAVTPSRSIPPLLVTVLCVLPTACTLHYPAVLSDASIESDRQLSVEAGPEAGLDAAPPDPCASKQCGTWDGKDCGQCTGSTQYCDESGQCVDDCDGIQCGLSPIKHYDCGQCSDPTPYCTALGHCMALPTWMPIRGRSFEMGSTTGQSSEQPVHTVVVPDFEMTRSEITVLQYTACVDDGTCDPPGEGQNCNWEETGYGDHPINCVQWTQAKVYCTWAGGRLPTEAEWEYAARSGGQDVDYPWGNDTATCQYAVMYDGSAIGCGTGRTMPVCSKPQGNTQQGLCDMAGNVWEWTEDDWHPNYEDAPSDGSAWVDRPRASDRVLRGGGYGSGQANSLRAANRFHYSVTETYSAVGVRCVR